MPRYSKQKEKYHIERIQAVLFVEPTAGAVTIQKALERDPEEPVHLDLHYINRLLRKVEEERLHRYDAKRQKHVGKEIAKMEDAFAKLRAESLRILTTNAHPNAKIGAIKAMWQMTIDLFEKKLDAGIFERQIGKMKMERPLTQENEALLHKAIGYALRSRQAVSVLVEKNSEK